MITELKPNQIFVFGSNVDGWHGGGAARAAMQWGAEYGNPKGIQGQTYAIPTCDLKRSGDILLSWDEITQHLKEFAKYAREHPELEFLLTPIGTGIAGGKMEDLNKAVSAVGLPDNVIKVW